MTDRIRIIDTQTLHKGWSRLTRTRLDYLRPDGTWQRQEREVFDHGHAAAVLLHDPVRDTVLLTRQFRLPVHLNGADGWIIEVCAGLLDGDDPETCARREALEETGHAIDQLEFAFSAVMSPGSLTESVSCFVGTFHDGTRQGDGGGLPHEGEDIEVIEMPFSEALDAIATGAIFDAKTIMLLQYLALRRAGQR